MSSWHAIGLTISIASAGVVVLALVGLGSGLTFLVYLLVLGALALLACVLLLQERLPLAPKFGVLIGGRTRPTTRIQQLERIDRLVSAAGWNSGELHYRLRPVVQEVLTARLSRQHGLVLAREPERVHELVGDGPLWELARPDREPPHDRHARGWPVRDLEQLLRELERL